MLHPRRLALTAAFALAACGAITVPKAVAADHIRLVAQRTGSLAWELDVIKAHGLDRLIAPVRPTWKDRYPLTPIDKYVLWRREDGFHYDPWIRTHERLGAEILSPAPKSMTVIASREEWEEWTTLQFPEDGDYVVPGALVPVRFEGGKGTYVEPNVWMRHPA